MAEAKLIERVRKLLALGTSSNANEAASAMRAAQKLMTEHNITMAQAEPDGGYRASLVFSGRMSQWKRDLARSIAHVNGCILYSQPEPEGRKGFDFFFVGEPQGCAACTHLFTYLCAEIARFSHQDLRGASSEEKNSYHMGISMYLISQLQEMDEAMQSSADYGLVLRRSESVAEWIKNRVKVKPLPNNPVRKLHSIDAFEAGWTRGQDVDGLKNKKLPGEARCQHLWSPYTQLPPGEPAWKWWKCTTCGCMGSVATRPLESRASEAGPTPHLCTAKGCSKLATGRNWGRDNRGRLKWVCDDHADGGQER